MEKQFWQERWDTKQLGFHEGKPNDLLVSQHARIADRKRVLVPLAGKAVDLWWLAERGHEVIGVEFVREAIDQFFEGHGAKSHEVSGHPAWSAKGVTLIHADIFDVKIDCDACYDRAALVAMDPKERQRYVRAVEVNGPTLLIAFSYDQSKAPGPPWSVDEKTVRSLYRDVEKLETRPTSVSPRLQQAGITSIDETAYLVTGTFR